MEDTDVVPEAKFSDKHSRRSKSKGEIALVKVILADLHEEIKSSKGADEASQPDFERRLQAPNWLQSVFGTNQTNLEEQIALTECEVQKEQDALGEN